MDRLSKRGDQPSQLETKSQGSGRKSASAELAEKLLWITNRVSETADAMGADVSAGLELIVADIAREPITGAQLLEALRRCRLEIRGTGGFPPRLTAPDILERAGIVYGAEAETLDGVAAWDLVMEVAAKHAFWQEGKCKLFRRLTKAVENCETCSGLGLYPVYDENGIRFMRSCPCREVTPIPELSQRILDVVERMGGWGIFKDMDTRSHPFARRDFLIEFGRWKKVEQRQASLPTGERALGSGGGLTAARLISEKIEPDPKGRPASETPSYRLSPTPPPLRPRIQPEAKQVPKQAHTREELEEYRVRNTNPEQLAAIRERMDSLIGSVPTVPTRTEV